jgi:hypothetical protein
MKAARLILYAIIVAVFILLFDLSFQWLVGNFWHFYNNHISDTLFWYIIKMPLFCLFLLIALYSMHLIVGGLSVYINSVSPFRRLSYYYVFTLLIANLLYWLYRIWIDAGYPFGLGTVISNLILSVIILDFTHALYVGQVASEK